MIEDPELPGLFMPIYALAGGKDLSTNPAIGAQYASVVQGYPYEVADRGIIRACEGREWRPGPEVVKAACELVLDELASDFMREAQAPLVFTPHERSTWSSLTYPQARERVVVKLCVHYGIKPGRFAACKTDRERARLLPGWDKYEPPAEPDRLRLLAKQAVIDANRRLEA